MIPTAEELRDKAERVISELNKEAKAAWLQNPCTQATFLLLEASRMQSIEAMENGATGEVLVQMMSQAQLASSLVDDLQDYIVDPQEEEKDD